MIRGAVIVCLALSTQLHGDFVSLFTPLEYQYTGGGYVDKSFRYRLFVPTLENESEEYPLIVWLHGYGEAGHDNIHHLRWLDRLILQPPWQRERYPFYLLAVQCPHDNANWFRTSGSQSDDDMVNVVAAIVKKTIEGNSIDPDRVYLAGLSSGGSGCWELASRHPDQFAAIAPLASTVSEQIRADQLAALPIWAFHSNRDAETSINPVRAAVKTLKEAGGRVVLTEIDSAEHDCWRAAFDDYQLLNWMLSQRRGGASWSNGPGSVSSLAKINMALKGWTLTELVLQAGVLVILLAAICFVVKQYRSS